MASFSSRFFWFLQITFDSALLNLAKQPRIANKFLTKKFPFEIIANSATGLAQRCMEESGKYALERKAFGQEIANFQAIQFMLAEMAISIETARLAYLKAAWEFGGCLLLCVCFTSFA